MATRFYFPSSGAADISPAYDANWDVTSYAYSRIALVTTRINSSSTDIEITGDNDSTNLDYLLRQYVSAPLAAQTITAQTIKWQMIGGEESSADNLYNTISIRVVSNDGGTVRGTLIALSRDDYELTPSMTNRQWYATSSQVVASENDRIVVEIGVGGDPTPAGDHNGTLRVGDDSSTDLPENDTEWNSYNPWVEFANTLSFAGGGTSTSDHIPAFLHGSVNTSDNISAYLRGGINVSDNVSAFLLGALSATGNVPAYLQGSLDTSSSISAWLAGGLDTSDSIPAFMEGALGASDHIPAFLQGQDTESDSIPAYLTGGVNVSDSVPSFLEGATTVATAIDIQSNEGHLAFASVANEYARAIANATPTSDVELLLKFTFGDTSSGGVFRAVIRSTGDWDDWQTPTGGYEFAIANTGNWVVNRIASGSRSQIGSDTWSASTSAYWVRIRAEGYQISARVWADGGGEPSTWDVDVDDTASGFTTAGTMQLGYFRVSGSHEMAIDSLSYHGLRRSHIPAYLEGTVTGTPVTDNVPAFLVGSSDTLDSLSAFLAGTATAIDSLPAFLLAQSTAQDAQPAFLAGHQHTSSSIEAFLAGSISTSDSVPAFLAGYDTALGNISAFLVGSSATSDSISAFLQGTADSLTSVPAYLAGSLDITESASAFLVGVDSSASNIPAFLAGSQDITDSISAFLVGKVDTATNIPAFLVGSLESTDNIPAYLVGSIDTSSSISGFLVGDDYEILIPDNDIAANTWQREPTGGTLASAIDETTPDDNDYAYEDTPVASESFEVSLSNPIGDPDDTGIWTIVWRAGNVGGSSTMTLKVDLVENTTVIATHQTVVSTSLQTYTYNLTQGEIQSITDPTDLRLRFTIVSVV